MAAAHLGEEHRPAIHQLDGQRGQRHDRQGQQPAGQDRDQVEAALGGPLQAQRQATRHGAGRRDHRPRRARHHRNPVTAHLVHHRSIPSGRSPDALGDCMGRAKSGNHVNN